MVEAPKELERRNEIPVRAARHVIDEDQVGLESRQHFTDDRRSHGLDEAIAQQQPARAEHTGRHLDHRRQLDEVDVVLQVEERRDRRIDDEQHRQIGTLGDQRVGQRRDPAQVAEPVTVLRVH